MDMYFTMHFWFLQVKKTCCVLILALLCSLALMSDSAPDCCRQKTCSCRLYDLLRGSGKHAAGILTLGKRKSSSQMLQTRLQRLLQGSGNQAAGILTMGKRAHLHPQRQCNNDQLVDGLASSTQSPLTLCPILTEPANIGKSSTCQ